MAAYGGKQASRASVLRLRGSEKEVSYLLPLICDWLSTVQVYIALLPHSSGRFLVELNSWYNFCYRRMT